MYAKCKNEKKTDDNKVTAAAQSSFYMAKIIGIAEYHKRSRLDQLPIVYHDVKVMQDILFK